MKTNLRHRSMKSLSATKTCVGLEELRHNDPDCPYDADIKNCETTDLKIGDLCEGDGECSTNNNLDNCEDYDIYQVVALIPKNKQSEYYERENGYCVDAGDVAATESSVLTKQSCEEGAKAVGWGDTTVHGGQISIASGCPRDHTVEQCSPEGCYLKAQPDGTQTLFLLECWEAYLPNFSHCGGYAGAGYICVNNWCAAVGPGGTPNSCAQNKGPNLAVNVQTGRCEKIDIHGPCTSTRKCLCRRSSSASGSSNGGSGSVMNTLCAAGTYQFQQSGGTLSCESCETGMYNDEIGRGSCKECAVGAYNDQTRQITESSCESCESGLYNEEKGQASCKECAVGAYNYQIGQITASSCESCQLGMYNDEKGQAHCKKCQQNLKPSLSQTSCVEEEIIIDTSNQPFPHSPSPTDNIVTGIISPTTLCVGLSELRANSPICPTDASNLMNCESSTLKVGDLCEGDGECSTDTELNNCDNFDIYLVTELSTSDSEMEFTNEDDDDVSYDNGEEETSSGADSTLYNIMAFFSGSFALLLLFRICFILCGGQLILLEDGSRRTWDGGLDKEEQQRRQRLRSGLAFLCCIFWLIFASMT